MVRVAVSRTELQGGTDYRGASLPDIGQEVSAAPALPPPFLLAPVLGALFLRGLPSRVAAGLPPLAPRHASDIVQLLRREGARFEDPGQRPDTHASLEVPLPDVRLGEIAEVLRRQGAWQAALILQAPRVLAEAAQLWLDGHYVTSEDPWWRARFAPRSRTQGDSVPREAIAYRPLRYGLGLPPLPPAVWCVASAPKPPAHASAYATGAGVGFGAVGSREVSSAHLDAASEYGRSVAIAGGLLISGDAFGCDRAAQQGALHEHGSVLAILPRGLTPLDAERVSACPGLCLISLAAPSEAFSAAAAMERNGWIYRLSAVTTVIHARHQVGGTWQGAVAALRQRSRLWVASSPPSPGGRALLSLGAEPLPPLSKICGAINTPAADALF